jgi:hypothetical protein
MTQHVVRTVGRYEILPEIRRGGIAAEYLARQIDFRPTRRAQVGAVLKACRSSRASVLRDKEL